MFLRSRRVVVSSSLSFLGPGLQSSAGSASAAATAPPCRNSGESGEQRDACDVPSGGACDGFFSGREGSVALGCGLCCLLLVACCLAVFGLGSEASGFLWICSLWMGIGIVFFAGLRKTLQSHCATNAAT